jgi:hypothetical protein
VQDDGMPTRFHLQRVYESTGILPTQLEPVATPDLLFYLWVYFKQLNETRGNNGYSPNPLSFLEIEAWCRLMKISLSSFDVECLMALDQEFLISYANQIKRKK